MKGVILNINPAARIVDLTVTPFDVLDGALSIATPTGIFHCARFTS
jgi:S-adenosylmethionine hydrolase